MQLIINDRIRNRTLQFFNRVKINLKYDAVASTFALDYYFDPGSPEHKELSCIGHYHICKLIHNGETLLTGYILSINFSSDKERHMVSIGGYSLPGVLEDCDIPTTLYPLQYDGVSLEKIATLLLSEFGLGLVVDGQVVLNASSNFKVVNNTNVNPTPPTAPLFNYNPLAIVQPKAPSSTPNSVAASNLSADGQIDKYGFYITPWAGDAETVKQKMNAPILSTTAPATGNIRSFLAKLASQKNITLSHDAQGNLVFTFAKTGGKPAAVFHPDTAGVVSMALNFNGQAMHSHITVLEQADTTNNDPRNVTLRNPYVPYVFRPKTLVNTSGDEENYTLASAKNALAEELRNLKISVTTDRWIFNGKVLKPNSVVKVQNPEIYLYKEASLFVESVELEAEGAKETAKLTCVLPSVYDGTQPTYLFHGINTH